MFTILHYNDKKQVDIIMSLDYRLLGERIKRQRRLKGTTQENFAEYLNVSVGYISQIERGISKVSLERLIEISEYLDCGVDFLLEGTSPGDEKYLANELNGLFSQLSAYEKKMLTHLLKEYLSIKKE